MVDVSPSYAAHSTALKLVAQDSEESSGPSIEDADVIVAGGRGLGAPENFTLAEELAQALGGAVGATRAVVDAGWYPYSAQIGQTGKTVSPKLYVALGISGAIQHKVGMQSSGTIVAINKDANAPIFDFSDLGVVGDVHEIVPKLTELVRQRKVVSRPSDYPPPFDAADFVAAPTDPADERIEVGVLIVGAGPAGLACAIRLGQLLEERPGDGGAARRGSRRAAREGQAARLAPALRRGRRTRGLAPTLRRQVPDAGPAVVRRGARRGGLRPHEAQRAAASRRRRRCGTTATRSSPSPSSAASSPRRRRRAGR